MMLSPLRPVLNLPRPTIGFWYLTFLANLAKSSNALIKQMFLITEAKRDYPVFLPWTPIIPFSISESRF